MNMQKSFIAISIISFFFSLPILTLGQTTTPAAQKLVTFTVDVGTLSCKTGTGVASVLFVAEPKEGGYFEIIGGAINENGITLDRRVALKSGTYTWKGVVNEGYREVPPSIGEFTIPVCGAPSTISSKPAQKIPPSIIAAKEPTNITKNTENGAVVSTATTAPSSEEKENVPPDANHSGNFKVIISGLVILGLLILFFGLRRGKK